MKENKILQIFQDSNIYQKKINKIFMGFLSFDLFIFDQFC